MRSAPLGLGDSVHASGWHMGGIAGIGEIPRAARSATDEPNRSAVAFGPTGVASQALAIGIHPIGARTRGPETRGSRRTRTCPRGTGDPRGSGRPRGRPLHPSGWARRERVRVRWAAIGLGRIAAAPAAGPGAHADPAANRRGGRAPPLWRALRGAERNRDQAAPFRRQSRSGHASPDRWRASFARSIAP
jgi:hypothetical protein